MKSAGLYICVFILLVSYDLYRVSSHVELFDISLASSISCIIIVRVTFIHFLYVTLFSRGSLNYNFNILHTKNESGFCSDLGCKRYQKSLY